MQSLITRDDCLLVQASFAELEPDADAIAAAFYARLFELNPDLAPLFKTDMKLQGEKFMEKLAVAVMGLEDLGSLIPLVQKLGRDHAGYGIEPVHYEMAREALLWALGDHFGPSFNSELSRAWGAAFDTISTEMIGATEGHV
jgi:hemoglobin-like flavoprotein